jgi:hypothetical protein
MARVLADQLGAEPPPNPAMEWVEYNNVSPSFFAPLVKL